MAKKKRPSTAKSDWYCEIKRTRGELKFYATTKKAALAEIERQSKIDDKITLWKMKYEKRKVWKVK